MKDNPIFIGVTRSFWFGIVPALLTALDMLFSSFGADGATGPFAGLLTFVAGQFFGWTPEQVQGTMQALAPIYALIVAQQRAGAARPYSFSLKDLK